MLFLGDGHMGGCVAADGASHGKIGVKTKLKMSSWNVNDIRRDSSFLLRSAAAAVRTSTSLNMSSYNNIILTLKRWMELSASY